MQTLNLKWSLIALPLCAAAMHAATVTITPNPLPDAREHQAYDETMTISISGLPAGYKKLLIKDAEITGVSVFTSQAPTTPLDFRANELGLAIDIGFGSDKHISGIPSEGTGTVFGTSPTKYRLNIYVSYQYEVGGSYQMNSANVNVTLYVNDAGPTSIAADMPVAFEGDDYNPTLTPNVPVSGHPTQYDFFTATGLPQGLSMDNKGAVAGIPAPGTSNGSPYIVLVSYMSIGSGEWLPSLVVRLVVVQHLALATSSLPQGAEGVLYDTTLQLAGGTAPYTFSNVSGLPDGLAMSGDGLISGVPYCGAAEYGPWTIEFDVADSTSPAIELNTQQLVLDVSGPILTLTQLSAVPPQTEAVSADVALTDIVSLAGASQRITWSLVPLPAGLNLVQLSAGARILGTPRVGSAGVYSCTLEVEERDAYGAHSTSLPLSITVNQPGVQVSLNILTVTLPRGVQGEDYPLTRISAAGGSAPYSFQATGLPQGLQLSGDTVAGTPVAAGSYPVRIAVTDADETRASSILTLVIQDGGEVPTAQNPSLLPVDTSAITTGLVGGAAAGACAIGALSGPGWKSLAFILAVIATSRLWEKRRKHERRQ